MRRDLARLVSDLTHTLSPTLQLVWPFRSAPNARSMKVPVVFLIALNSHVQHFKPHKVVASSSEAQELPKTRYEKLETRISSSMIVPYGPYATFSSCFLFLFRRTRNTAQGTKLACHQRVWIKSVVFFGTVAIPVSSCLSRCHKHTSFHASYIPKSRSWTPAKLSTFPGLHGSRVLPQGIRLTSGYPPRCGQHFSHSLWGPSQYVVSTSWFRVRCFLARLAARSPVADSRPPPVSRVLD
jgi:hypothetical protein